MQGREGSEVEDHGGSKAVWWSLTHIQDETMEGYVG